MLNQQSVQSTPESPKVLTPLQDYFLDKLGHYLKKRRSYIADPGHDATLLKVLDRAIYVTYLDCLNQGVGDEARKLVTEFRDPSASTPPSKN